MSNVVNVVQINQPATMTSLQIVEMINDERKAISVLTGKAPKVLLHKTFLTKARDVLGDEGQQNFLHTHVNQQNGQSYPIYIFPKREATLMAMSYSPAISAAVYDKMTALEEYVQQTDKPVLPNFNSPAEAARAWAIEYERSEQLALVVEQKETLLIEQAPKVEFHDSVTSAGNCHTMEEAAKILGWGRNNLFKWLRESGILMQDSTLPYQRHITEGHFSVVENPWKDRVTEIVHIKTRTLVTGKGLVYIQKKLSEAGMMKVAV